MFTLLLALAVAEPSASGAIARRDVSTVEIRVTDRAGKPLPSAHVELRGTSEREGDTNRSGRVIFRNMQSGTYVVHVERDAFIALEKELALGIGRPATVVAALSPAPRVVAQRNRDAESASPTIVSLPALAEKSLIRQETMSELPIACAGASGARLIQVREPLTTHAHRTAEEMLYVIAGEGMLKIGDKEQRVGPGWFSVVPRGAMHSMTRRGKNPIIVLSVTGGEPCTQPLAIAHAGR